jgi:hypothetical protein
MAMKVVALDSVSAKWRCQGGRESARPFLSNKAGLSPPKFGAFIFLFSPFFI